MNEPVHLYMTFTLDTVDTYIKFKQIAQKNYSIIYEQQRKYYSNLDVTSSTFNEWNLDLNCIKLWY